MAGIGRVSGAMLSSNLDRQGYPLNFVSGTNTLMHLDFSGSKVGINTDTVTESLTINGNLSTSDVLINNNTISAKNDETLYVVSPVHLGNDTNVYITGGNDLDILVTDGSGHLNWFSANLWLANSNFLQNVTINGSTISTNTTNGNLTLLGNGAGVVYMPSAYATHLSAETIVSGNINGAMIGAFTGDAYGTFTGNVLTAAQPAITSVGTLTGLTSSGNITAPVVNAALHGDVYTDNIFGIDGNLTIHPQPGTVLTIDSTAAQILPAGLTGERPTGPAVTAGAFRYNTEAHAPEYFNGTEWVSMASEISSQTLNGNGSADTFLLNYHTSANGVIVSINGTVQQPNIAYAIDPQNSNYIVFTEVPRIGDVIEVRFLSTTTIIEMAQQNALTVVSPTIGYGTSPVVIDEFRMSEFRSAKYTVSAQAANGDLLMSDVMVIHNGITATCGASSVGTYSVATYTANTAGGNVQVKVQTIASGASLKIYKLYFPI